MIKNKNIKVSFMCNWGQTPLELHNKYKLFTPFRRGSWENLESTPSISDSDVVFLMEGPGPQSQEVIRTLKNKRLFVIRHEPPTIIPSSRLGLNAVPAELREQTTLIDYETQPIWFFSKWELAYSHTPEELMNFQYPSKEAPLSCLVSNKTMVPGHVKRLQFVQKIINTDPNLLTLFGRNRIPYRKHMGAIPAEKKYKAYERFHYTLCFENSQVNNYFSDKIFDSLLMWSMPIYWGAPNLGDYIPQESFHTLGCDLGEADIHKVIEICKTRPTKENIEAIREARHLIMNKYSLWPSLKYILDKN